MFYFCTGTSQDNSVTTCLNLLTGGLLIGRSANPRTRDFAIQLQRPMPPPLGQRDDTYDNMFIWHLQVASVF